MKYIATVLTMFVAVVLIASSCKTEIVTPIDIFSLEKGGYMRIISGTSCVSSASVKRTNMAGTNLTMIHEAVTPSSGANFSAYDLEIRHVGATSCRIPVAGVPNGSFPDAKPSPFHGRLRL